MGILELGLDANLSPETPDLPPPALEKSGPRGFAHICLKGSDNLIFEKNRTKLERYGKMSK